jgi:hypothetical protein
MADERVGEPPSIIHGASQFNGLSGRIQRRKRDGPTESATVGNPIAASVKPLSFSWHLD